MSDRADRSERYTKRIEQIAREDQRMYELQAEIERRQATSGEEPVFGTAIGSIPTARIRRAVPRVECAGVPSAVVEGIELLRQGGTFGEEGHFVDIGNIQLNW